MRNYRKTINAASIWGVVFALTLAAGSLISVAKDYGDLEGPAPPLMIALPFLLLAAGTWRRSLAAAILQCALCALYVTVSVAAAYALTQIPHGATTVLLWALPGIPAAIASVTAGFAIPVIRRLERFARH